MAAIDAGEEGRIAFEAPQVPAFNAQADGRVADGVYGGAVHRVRVAAVGTGRDRCPAKVPLDRAVPFDGDQERVLNVVGEKLPHPQEITWYCLAHGLRPLLGRFGVDYGSILSQMEQEPNEKITTNWEDNDQLTKFQ